MAKTKPGHRIVLQLDLRMALEAIIVNRLERLPATRRQEWLRGLLVQGFRSECQALRGAPDAATGRPVAGFSNWKAGETPKPVSLTAQEPVFVQPSEAQATRANKPFAALGKVIG